MNNSWYLGVSIDGCIVQGKVIVKTLGIDVGAGSEQLLCDVHIAVVARLVQWRPTCNDESHTRYIKITWLPAAPDDSHR